MRIWSLHPRYLERDPSPRGSGQRCAIDLAGASGLIGVGRAQCFEEADHDLALLGRQGRSDVDSGRANAGWKKFLGINYVVGFLVTMLLIWYAALTAGAA